MAIFAGKSIYGAAFELQSRVFLKPWLKKISIRCCSNFGDRSKDFPVRYTPKRSSKSNKLDDSTPCPKESENYEVRRSINPNSMDEKSPDKDFKSDRRFINPDSSSVEISNDGERSRIGSFLDEKSPYDDLNLDRRFTNPDSSIVEISNDGEGTRIGSFFDEKSPYDDFKLDRLFTKPNSTVVESSNNGERSRIGSFFDEKSPYDDFKLDRRFTKPDSLSVEISNDGERSRIGSFLDEKSSDDDFKSDHRFTNLDSSIVEISNNGEGSRIGSFLDEKSPCDDFKSGKLKSKEKKICNSAVRSEVGEHDYNWRFAESNSIEEELDEFDAMEGPEEVLDELDTHNGNYDIKQSTPEPSKTKEAAEKTTYRLLAARAYTALELKKKLLGKKFSHEVVNAVISDFQNRGFINDLSYAEAFSRSRWSSSSWGPHRIKQALIKKGVIDLDAQKAIKLVFEDGEPNDDDQSSRFGLSKPSLDHLFAQASKQWLRAKDLPVEKQKSRLITWLQYRGFNWGVISFILKKLQSGHPP